MRLFATSTQFLLYAATLQTSKELKELPTREAVEIQYGNKDRKLKIRIASEIPMETVGEMQEKD